MTTTEIITRCNLTPVPRGRMSRIGWYAGYLVVEYTGGTYIFGPAIAEAERDKLLRVPYPDNTLNQLKKKHEWKSHKVRLAPQECEHCDQSGCTRCGKGL